MPFEEITMIVNEVPVRQFRCETGARFDESSNNPKLCKSYVHEKARGLRH
jgi:hypothetical protein